MAITPEAGAGDPAVLRQIQRQNAILTTKPQLSSPPPVSGSSSTPVGTTANNLRSLAPIVSGAETLYPQSTTTTSSNAITITSSISNDAGDITTVYAAGGRVSATAINQTINQFTAVDSGVSQVLAGAGILVSSTGPSGKGVVTITASIGASGNIITINLDGNVANVLRGDGTWSADANSSYGNSNVVSLMAAFGSNTITTTGNVSVGNIIGNGQALSSIAGANVSGQVGNALVAGTVYTAAQPNITSVGTLGNLTVSGNVTISSGELKVNNDIIISRPDGRLVFVSSDGTSNGMYIERSTVDSQNWIEFSSVNSGNDYLRWGIPGLRVYSNVGSLPTLSFTANAEGVTTTNVAVTGIVKTGVYTTGTIPAAATAGAGARAFVTDADAATFKAAYVGGSGNAVPVFSDGSAWYIG